MLDNTNTVISVVNVSVLLEQEQHKYALRSVVVLVCRNVPWPCLDLIVRMM